MMVGEWYIPKGPCGIVPASMVSVTILIKNKDHSPNKEWSAPFREVSATFHSDEEIWLSDSGDPLTSREVLGWKFNPSTISLV